MGEKCQKLHEWPGAISCIPEPAQQNKAEGSCNPTRAIEPK